MFRFFWFEFLGKMLISKIGKNSGFWGLGSCEVNFGHIEVVSEKENSVSSVSFYPHTNTCDHQICGFFSHTKHFSIILCRSQFSSILTIHLDLASDPID